MKGRLTTKNEKYYVVISYQDESGKNKQKWVATGLDAKNNKRAAEEAMRKIVADFNGNNAVDCKNDKKSPDNVLFGDYLTQWIEIAKANLQLSTYAAYKGRIKLIAPYFNERQITLNGITPVDIQTYYKWLIDNGKTIQTCTHTHTIIRRALEIAYRTDIIPTNPAAKVQKPKSPKYEAKYYDIKQLKTLFECMRGDRFELMYKMTAFYGLRRSELCGMQWNSIDFEKDTFTLNHSIVQIRLDGKSQLVQKDLMKNASSKRTMPLIPDLKEALIELKQRQENNRKLYVNGYDDKYEKYVWVDDLGKIVNPDTLTVHFKTLLAQNGLPKIRFHELRHSCASLLIACGVSLKEIQEWLGHSAISTTADIYSHLNYSSKLNVANTLTTVFGGGTLDVKAQDTDEAQALLTILFKGAKHGQAETEDTDYIAEEISCIDMEINGNPEREDKIAKQTSENSTVAEYKKAKAEMARLGFETLDEYFDYVEYIKLKAKRRSE